MRIVISLGLVTNKRGSVLMHAKVISLRLVTRHDVAGSEAECSASSKGLQDSYEMTNVPYFVKIRN